MLSSLRGVAALLLLTFTAVAQPSHVGDPFPLTATRYGTARGHDPLLLSNGHDPVVFWHDDQHVRVSRFANGRFGMSRVVLPGTRGDFYDALWTGEHFLVVSGGVHGRLLDAKGEPLGEPFVIAQGWNPRIAFNGENVLLLYTSSETFDVNALLLNADGVPVESSPRPLDVEPAGRIALTSNGDSFAALVPRALDPLLLLFDARGRLQSSPIFGQYGSGAAIASDGRRYLAVAACGDGGACMTAYSRLIEADGSVGSAVDLDPPYRTKPSVVWNGAKWVIAYMRDAHLLEGTSLEVVELDAAARTIERRAERRAVETSIGVIGNRVLAAWVGENYRDTIFLGDLPFDAATAIPASFTATGQWFPASTASLDGTLVVWQEMGGGKTTLHTGLRANDGSWSERQILSFEPRDCHFCYEESVNVSVASNGSEFLLATHGAPERLLRRLDRNGEPIAEIAMPGLDFPWWILWDGQDYLLLYADRSVTRMTSSGTVVWTKTLPSIVGQSNVFASDGNGGLIAVRIDQSYADHYPTDRVLKAVRLDRDLNPIDATPIELAVDDQYQYLSAPAAGWDGRQYVVAWVGRYGVTAAHVAASGAANPKVVKIGGKDAHEIAIAPVSGGAAIQWNEAHGPNHLAFVRYDGSATTPIVISESQDRGWEFGQIASLSNGDLGYIESSQQPFAPFENTMRITFRVISNVPLPARPAAPRLSASVLPTREAALTWEAPPQPVDGFRLEMRVDDGPWSEVPLTLARDARELRVPMQPASRYAFRMRAWNATGTGAYSNAATPAPARRPAVRR